MKKIIILFLIIFILLISCNKENFDIKNNLNEITVSVGPEPSKYRPDYKLGNRCYDIYYAFI